MKSVITSVLFSIATIANAQYQAKVDSLEQIVEQLQGHEKVIVLRDLCYYSSRFDFEKSVMYGEQAVAVAKEINDKNDIGGAYNDLATAHKVANRLETALSYYDQSLSAFKETNNLKQQSYILNNIGSAHKSKGDKDLALNYYIQSLLLRDSLGNVQTGTVLNNIGLLHKENGDVRLALDYFQKALQQDMEEGDVDGMAHTYNNIGIAYEELDMIDSALYYANKAYEIDLEAGNDYSVAIDLNNMGEAYYSQGDLDKAVAYFEESLTMKYRLNNTIGIAHTSGRLAAIYQEKRQYMKALTYVDDALNLAKANGNKDKEMSLHLLKADICDAKGEYQNALMQHREYARVKDEIFDRDKALIAADLATKYQSQKKQAENDLLMAKTEQQKAVLARREIVNVVAVIGTILLAITAGVFFWAYRQKLRSNQMLSKQKEELSSLNSTKDRFFGIIAHDLRGPLTALQGISGLLTYTIKKGDLERLNKIGAQVEISAAQVNSLLDNLLQWALHQSGNISYRPERLSLKAVIDENLKYFSDMAAAKDITLSNKVTDNTHIVADKESISTVIRNLVNNGIKFTPKGGEVNLSAMVEDGQVKINIQDTGLGISADLLEKIFTLGQNSSTPGTHQEKGTGLGLVLVNDFVKMNHGSLKVSSTPNVGSTFSVIIPAA
ncbi:MAG: tetratricopeptide repeat protein [Cyclobacteriaceae bacterium]